MTTHTPETDVPLPSDEQVLDVLVAAVRAGTGIPHATPRDGQGDLTLSIWGALTTPAGAHLAAAATGLGKSLSYLTPALLLNATTGKRTVIATESLSLQAQIIDKDAPVVADAVQKATGVHVDVQVLKGWSNFVCLRAALATAHTLLQREYRPSARVPTERELADLAQDLEPVCARRARAGVAGVLGPGDEHEVDGRRYPASDIAVLTRWALAVHATQASGDRDTYPGDLEAGAWPAVSATPAECVGVGTCALADLCRPAAAKARACEADVIVTNHSLLSVQAARGIGVVVGSPKLGRFDAVVVDEAHGLPGQVRNQGACEVSGRRVGAAVRALRSILTADASTTKALLDSGEVLATLIDDELSRLVVAKAGREGVVRLVEGDDPLPMNGPTLERWCVSAASLLGDATKGAHGDAEIRARRVKARLDGLRQDLGSVCEHRTGVARWVQQDQRSDSSTIAARSTPVDVAALLNQNLWTTRDEDSSDDSDTDLSEEISVSGFDGRRRRLSVVAVSATLPRGFGAQIGVNAPMVRHPSPFAEALEHCMLFVPRASDPAAIAALGTGGYGPKPRFDTTRHVAWATPLLVELVQANGGSALVLSATVSAGQQYAAALRARLPHLRVLTQWDGPPLRTQLARWKDDVSSVMVGTRSLMTGVDAPGQTCTLVVIDRVPRSPSNPVDDARVEDMMARAQMDKWAAERIVYGGDAALLLKQAGGRLVRSASDHGMVAMLDPRMLKLPPFAYAGPTRELYMEAFEDFQVRTTDLERACSFLRGQAPARAA